eukprot:TRINITY_DN61986_c0_g1_i1.p1 TRINITY_DN61986_c0_g1~~TRINITY_DN61986_c0_g1_i1.p1  ORF type:complete len:423 (-),score=83.66 TRINITY_DN61986_c0_g1_i1:79-1203(-)
MAGTKLFVGGIPAGNATNDQIAELFAQQGVTPMEVVILPPRGSNPETRCGFVRVPVDEGDFAIQAMNGMTFEGYTTTLNVRVADNQGTPLVRLGGPGVPHAGATPPPPVAPPNWTNAKGGPPGGAAVVHPPTHPNGGISAGGPPVVMPPPLSVPGPSEAAEMKIDAKAAGRWFEAAEWKEQEYASAQESSEARFQRLSIALHAAAAAEFFYEAATLLEGLKEIDPEGALRANATAAAAAAAASGNFQAVSAYSPAAPPLPPPPRMAAPQPPPPAVIRPPPPAVTPAPPPTGLNYSPEQRDFTGTILVFHADRHYGFVQCPELGCDAFLSDKQIGSFKVGDLVTFNVIHNTKGKPQAQNLRPAEEPSRQAKRART